MNFIKGYKHVPYKDLQKELETHFDKSEKSLAQIAAAAGVSTTNTIQSAIKNDSQIVSDKVLTSVFDAIGLSAFVMWINGERQYFIKSKN